MRSSTRAAYVVGTLPEGFTTPQSSSATTWPSSAPWFHTSSTVSARSIHGSMTGVESLRTTTVVRPVPSSASTIRAWP